MDAAVATGRAFIDAIVARDWDPLAGCFAPDARSLAVVAHDEHPFGGKTGGTAAGQMSPWFDIADETVLLPGEVEPLADRVRIMYGIRQHKLDGWNRVERLAGATPGAAGVDRVDSPDPALARSGRPGRRNGRRIGPGVRRGRSSSRERSEGYGVYQPP